jgi:membrane associated rhomboid family serine protease
VDLDDLEEDIRQGRIPPTAEFRLNAEEEFRPLGQLEAYREAFDTPNARLAQHLRAWRFPWASSLLTLSVLVAGLGQLLLVILGSRMGQGAVRLSQFFQEAVTGLDPLFFEGAWWSPWSSQLVHGGPGHLFPNLAVLGYAGYRVERALGTGAYVVVVAASVLLGSLSVAAFGSMPVMGSSLAGYGLFGALLAIGFRFGDTIPPHYRRFYGFGNLALFAVLFISGLGVENASHSGHAGALLAGSLSGMFVRADSATSSARARARRRGNLLLGALLFAAPMGVAPLVLQAPGLVLGPLESKSLQGIEIQLPGKLADHPGRLRGLEAWTTSVFSRDAVFCGVERVGSRSMRTGEEFRDFWGGSEAERTYLLDAPESLGPGWTGLAAELPDSTGGARIEVVEHQYLRGEWLLRVGYLLKRRPSGRSGRRKAVFEAVMGSVVIQELPDLAEAREAFAGLPGSIRYGVEYARQLDRAGEVAEADGVLAGLLTQASEQGIFAARLRLALWARDGRAEEAPDWFIEAAGGCEDALEELDAQESLAATPAGPELVRWIRAECGGAQ